MHIFAVDKGFPYSAVYSKNERRILSAYSWGAAKEWNRETGECLCTFEEGGYAYAKSAIYSEDEQSVLSISHDDSIREWDRETGMYLGKIPPHFGLHIVGCEFKGCHFTTPEIRRMIRINGGIV